MDKDEALKIAREALASYLTGVDCDSPVMEAWDSARPLILQAPESSLGREVFETALDEIEEKAREALVAIDTALQGGDEMNRAVQAAVRTFDPTLKTSIGEQPIIGDTIVVNATGINEVSAIPINTALQGKDSDNVEILYHEPGVPYGADYLMYTLIGNHSYSEAGMGYPSNEMKSAFRERALTYVEKALQGKGE